MNEDVFNASLRRFLKKVGITSQREIEKAVRDALESGRLKGHEKLPAKMVLTIGGVSLSQEITDEFERGGGKESRAGALHSRPPDIRRRDLPGWRKRAGRD